MDLMLLVMISLGVVVLSGYTIPILVVLKLLGILANWHYVLLNLKIAALCLIPGILNFLYRLSPWNKNGW